jgi:cytochrome c peroxidase
MRIDRHFAAGALLLPVVLIVAALGRSNMPSEAQAPATPPFEVPQSLKTIAVPAPPNLGEFILDKAAAIRLGKALFWDMQVGSDGVVACATCHFQAGADGRLQNQLHPGPSPGDTSFHPGSGPNSTLTVSDFPFHRLQSVDNRNSRVLSDRNDVAGSQGVVAHRFTSLGTGAIDNGELLSEPVFSIGTSALRRATARNAPSVINAVFNHRNFWDGRAQNEFNGVNPFGDRDPRARVFRSSGGLLSQVRIRIPNASLASQAVGPPLNGTEMSWDGRMFRHLGRKLLREANGVIPLGKQLVHPTDSSLGPLANSRLAIDRQGLSISYAQMIRAAFQPKWWNSSRVIRFDPSGNAFINQSPPRGPLPEHTFTQMEANFSLFFGLAIQMYEATLVANDSPFDRFLEGNTNALTQQERQGFLIFFGRGRCFNCHTGPEMTEAAVSHVSVDRIELMPMGTGVNAVYDTGFYNIGVRPTTEDHGLGGNEPTAFGGKPLSHSRMVQLGFLRDPALRRHFDRPGMRTAIDGSFKTPGLRNVELTGPYFHNGGQATLMHVVEFYNRGGDFADENIQDLNPAIQPLRLSLLEKRDLVQFLKALTDPRVRMEKAPFDHPQLFIPNGHQGNQFAVVDDGTGQGKDTFRELPAVGAGGGPAIQPVFPQ